MSQCPNNYQQRRSERSSKASIGRRGNQAVPKLRINLEEDNWDNVVYDMLGLVFVDNKSVKICHYKTNEARIRIANIGSKNLHDITLIIDEEEDGLE